MSQVTKYTHHGRRVFVQEALKGRHQEHCLCWQGCRFFNPEDRESSCPVANLVFALCVAQDLVLPVWECPLFEE